MYHHDATRETRILRDRFDALADRRDNAAARRPESGAARIALSVIDGGSMPTAADHYFLGNPVMLGGSEAEGGSWTSTADTSTQVPFIALHNAPSVGDILVATSVGGRWVAEKHGGSLKICVSVCFGKYALVGGTVEVYSGTTLVGSCTTDSTGCCTPTGVSPGTYTVKIYAGSDLLNSASRTLTGGTNTIWVGSPTNSICCGSYFVPDTITLTDADASCTLDYISGSSPPAWEGGHAITELSCTVTTPNNVCVVASPTNGPVRVCYTMTCNSGSSPVFSLQRSWSWVYQQGTNTPIYYQDPTGFTPGQLCITAPPGICGNPLTDTSSGSGNPSSTSPFSITFANMTAAISNSTTEPITGNVTVSQ